jgi:hypothetical protein
MRRCVELSPPRVAPRGGALGWGVCVGCCVDGLVWGFGAAGAWLAQVTGVCINPACDPFDGGSIDPTADCTSATQYHHCDANSPGPGWYDRTYTLVQGVATP